MSDGVSVRPGKRRRLVSAARRLCPSVEQRLTALHVHARSGGCCVCDENAWGNCLSAALQPCIGPADDSQLLALSCLQLLQESALRGGGVCGRLLQLSGQLVRLLGEDCQLASCAAARCLTRHCLLSPDCAQDTLQQLVRRALESPCDYEVAHALSVLQQLLESREEEPAAAAAGGCAAFVGATPDAEALSELKCSVTALLESRWLQLTQRFCHMLTSAVHQTEVLAFLSLWTTLVTVSNNLSVLETKAFQSGLERLLAGLTAGASALVWRAVLALYGEVLCYGSTLALQDCVPDEPAATAHSLLRLVRSGRLLELVPSAGPVLFGGGRAADGDRLLVQRLVLLVLKALAVTVKETRCDSSSDSSTARGSGSEGQTGEDMRLIERCLREVLRRLDSWLKSRVPFHPETPPCQWLVLLLCDQDDLLVECLLCLQDISAGLPSSLPCICPHAAFLQFLDTVRLDPDLLLDFLISNETCFLLYLLRLLKHVRRCWPQFRAACGARLDDVMSVLIRLRITLQRLVERQLFPYNVAPLLKLLVRCELLYDSTASDVAEHDPTHSVTADDAEVVQTTGSVRTHPAGC